MKYFRRGFLILQVEAKEADAPKRKAVVLGIGIIKCVDRETDINS